MNADHEPPVVSNHPAPRGETREETTNAARQGDQPESQVVVPSASRLRARGVAVHDRHRPLLPATSLSIVAGEVVAVSGDPGHGHTALALALGGRLLPNDGNVDIDGDSTAVALQRAVALVDVPGVSEPDGAIPASTVVGEELAMVGRKAGAKHVAAWFDDNDLAHVRRSTIEDLTPHDRVVLLTSLAALRARPFLVLVLPERHGGLPSLWLPHLEQLADSGLGVLVTTGTGLAAHIPDTIRTATLGDDTAEDLS